MTTTQQTQSKKLAQFIEEAMNDTGMSIKDVAMNSETTYEHIRRIVRGESIPSKYALREICRVLGADFPTALKLSQTDKLHKTFGDLPAELAGKRPELQPIERVWDDLSEQHKKDLLDLAQQWAKRDRFELRLAQGS